MPVSKNRKSHTKKANSYKQKTVEAKKKQEKMFRTMVDEYIKKQQGLNEQPSAEVIN
jgi:hypothetical protein